MKKKKLKKKLCAMEKRLVCIEGELQRLQRSLVIPAIEGRKETSVQNFAKDLYVEKLVKRM